MKTTAEINRRLSILLGILLCAIITAGCGQPIKNSWDNFRAYHNTYYNAKKNYQNGLDKIRKQPVSLDPSKPVRIHPSPIQAGKADFEQAIEKAAKVLRKFSDSKWADDALFLIGKAYYYQQEFFAALEKFEELRNASESAELERQAIIWKGRTLLDLKNYSEGISFLETELAQYPENWPTDKKAEMRTIFAEHLVMLEHWADAESAFLTALPNIESQSLLGRTYFLYGQVLERLNRYGEAYVAFSRVSKNFVDFEYGYWGEMKRADAARKDGRLDLAIRIYKKLKADDKNIDRIPAIDFEIARTLEMQGKVAEAERRYKELLYRSSARSDGTINGRIYFRLGIINSEYFNNFRRAAAYFDTASSVGTKPKINTNAPDAQTMADAFGRYVDLKNSITRADSLLHLGTLSASQLDSVIADIRERKRRALLEQQTGSQSKLANRQLTNGNDQQAVSGEYGFLNHRSTQFVQQGISEFKVRWGDRPLVDNWRRIEAVRRSSTDDEKVVAHKSTKSITADSIIVNLSLEDIPRTKQARSQLYREQANARYKLGNLFFFTLNIPDSARSYFRKVVNSSPSQSLRARAMYSLYESYKTQNSADSLKYWRDRILEQYPNSEYAFEVRKKGSKAGNNLMAEDSNTSLRKKYHRITAADQYNRPARLRRLALANRSSALAPHIYYEAIEGYIRRAKNERMIADSLVPPKMDFSSDSSAESSFKSSAWDSVRFALGEFDSHFPNAGQQKKVSAMRSFLGKQEQKGDISTCRELDISLTIMPDKQAFLTSVSYPEKLQGQSLSGEVEYRFTVSADGSIESYTLTSTRTSLGIEEAFENAFDESLRFGQLPDSLAENRIRCRVRFPIRQ